MAIIKPIIETIELFQLASGDSLSIQLYKFQGQTPGKKVYIQANLHGCEIVGNGVIHQLLEFFSNLDANQLVGEIWIVPTCNPLGTNQRGHFYATGGFNPYSGEDWNRIFWEYEPNEDELQRFVKNHLNSDVEAIVKAYRKEITTAFATELDRLSQPCGASLPEHFRAKLQGLCLDADSVIDIHSSSNEGLDFLYYFCDREQQAQWFGFDYGILLSQGGDYAFDEAFIWPWIALEQAFLEAGRQLTFDINGVTLELGTGMKMRPESIRKGVAGIKNYLIHQGLLQTGEKQEYRTKFLPSQNITRYRSPVGGMVKRKVSLGENVKTGQCLYEVIRFNRIGTLPEIVPVHSMVDGLVFDLAISESVNQGEYVMSVLELSA